MQPMITGGIKVASSLMRRGSTGSIDPTLLQSVRNAARELGLRRSSLTTFSGVRSLSSPSSGAGAPPKPDDGQGLAGGESKAGPQSGAADAEGSKPVDRPELYPSRAAAAKLGDRPVAILSGTGGMSSSAALALLTKKRPGKQPPEIQLFSRQNPEAIEDAGGLRVEASITGKDGKRETFHLTRHAFPSLQWRDNKEVPEIADGSIVIEGGSALHLEKQIKPLSKHKGLDILTMANGLNHRQRLERHGPGLSVSPAQVWFNSKNHPDGKGGKYVTDGGYMNVNPRSEAFKQEIGERWNNGVVDLRLLAPPQARAAEIDKAVTNSCLNPLGIIFGKKMKAMEGVSGYDRLRRAITAECSSIVAMGGEPAKSGEEYFQQARGFALDVTKDKDFHTSSYAPFAAGQETELDFVNGEFARMAKSFGGNAPLNQALDAIVKDMTADRMSVDQATGQPKYASDEAFRADPLQQAKQLGNVITLFRLAGVPEAEASTLAARALAG